jgi:hypothetical protein
MNPERKCSGKKRRKTKPRAVAKESTIEDCSRYSLIRDGRVLDSEPMTAGENILVFDKASGSWVSFDGTFGEWRHSIAITAKQTARLTGGVAGYKPPKRRRVKSKATVADDPPQMPVPPFSVDFVDQFEGHCADGYGTVGSYDRLEDAIAEARRITEEGIKLCGGY